MTDRPVSRCAVRGCPVIGFWPAGGYCPMHIKDAPRPPTWDEAADTEGGDRAQT